MAWRQIENYNNYEVSSEGFVRNLKTGRVLKFDVSKNGYFRCTLCSNNKPKKFLIHRLVMKHFVGDSDLQVNHKDGDKRNNRLSNLEYVSCRDNHLHAQEIGLRPIGSSRSTALLNEEQVHKVCQMIEEGHRRGDILNAGISVHLKKHMVDNIRRRRTWKHVSCDYEW